MSCKEMTRKPREGGIQEAHFAQLIGSNLSAHSNQVDFMLHMNTAAPQSFMDTPAGVPVDSRDLQGWVKLINYVRD